MDERHNKSRSVLGGGSGHLKQWHAGVPSHSSNALLGTHSGCWQWEGGRRLVGSLGWPRPDREGLPAQRRRGQRRPALRRGGVHVGPGLQQQQHGVDRPRSGRRDERGGSLAGCRRRAVGGSWSVGVFKSPPKQSGRQRRLVGWGFLTPPPPPAGGVKQSGESGVGSGACPFRSSVSARAARR